MKEFFIPGRGTARECIDCGILVYGGSTRCLSCGKEQLWKEYKVSLLSRWIKRTLMRFSCNHVFESFGFADWKCSNCGKVR